MQPYGKNILFKPMPSDSVSELGIIVPDSCKKPSNKGLIVMVGEDCVKVKQGQIGFRVMDWGTELLIENELHFLMDESAIIAIEGEPNKEIKEQEKSIRKRSIPIISKTNGDVTLEPF